MADTIAQSVGVDISKDTLDVYLHPASIARRFANTRAGRSRVIAWLAEFAIARVVFEPTGLYHHAFERQLAEAGLPLAKVNPRQARRFAEAVGRHAKTDAVDAPMLARLAALLKPPVRSVVSQRLTT
jgi:transposase